MRRTESRKMDLPGTETPDPATTTTQNTTPIEELHGDSLLAEIAIQELTQARVGNPQLTIDTGDEKLTPTAIIAEIRDGLAVGNIIGFARYYLDVVRHEMDQDGQISHLPDEEAVRALAERFSKADPDELFLPNNITFGQARQDLEADNTRGREHLRLIRKLEHLERERRVF
ncbi:hypothetical protein HOG17_05190 [Candidatus Peregrinibacteria bacterium]|jgi:hypothetical protein|nr:hypothetical protein [Candidatus Peregrinibacteria bacterium]MBT4147809.1 hypothetical protein [Candidatus Peregrinibacteria bacterium]MBT4365827.1 hypothetical protein [Candidatus Peregrinibacteria bacterium]MBT4455676.1 hypothetical protein [Candidatus Peregrinibacteria bacterium]